MVLTSTTSTETKRYESIRQLANVTNVTWPNDKLNEVVLRWDNWGEVQTNKFDWVETDNAFESLLSAINLMCSAEVRDGIPGDDKAGEQRVAARDIIKAINRKDSEVQKGGSGLIASAGKNVTNELDPRNYIQDQTLPL